MVCICLDDMIIKRAKNKDLAINTKAITNTVLYSAAGVLIGTGIIGMPVLGNYMIIIGINQVVKRVIKKTAVINKVRGLIKNKRIKNAI